MNAINPFWPIPGKVKLLLISGKKSASLLDHISRFLSHQFVTWYLRSISKTKIVKLFCPCMSEHMIYIKNVTNVTQTLHQNAVLERVRTRTRTQGVSPSPSPDSDSTLVDSDSDSDSTSVDSDSSAVDSDSGLMDSDSDSDSTQVDSDSQ